MTSGINYVGTRYNDLADLLNDWGYVVVPYPSVSKWDEIVRASPLTGLVKLRGERDSDADKLSFSITEFWVGGDAGDHVSLVREGASLIRYHYHGQCQAGGVRWCLYPEGHPDMPYHLHPFSDPLGAAERGDQIDAHEALAEFETRVYLEKFGSADEDEE